MSIDELLEYNRLSSFNSILSLIDRSITGYMIICIEKGYPLEYSQRLRYEYEQERIRTEKDFTEVLYNDLLGR